MVTVPEIVEKYVSSTPFLEEGIAKGLINLSALARELKPLIREALVKDVQDGAIIMALKRYKPKLKAEDNTIKSILNAIGDITVKSNIVEYTLRNSHEMITRIKQLLERVESKPDKFITITQGITEITIIATESVAPDIEEILLDQELILKQSDLSSITVKLPPENVEVPGVYYHILKRIAWEGINIIDTVSTTNEITIVFGNKDIEKAFTLIKKLI